MKLMRVVRDEEGRPLHRGRIHYVRFELYTPNDMVDTLCGFTMWVTKAKDWDLDNLETCIICKKVPVVERLAERILR